MCLILIACQTCPRYPVILAANRDEFYRRPTREMHRWKGDLPIIAGKDLEQGGTWLGVHPDGRLAALTNYRDPSKNTVGARSRGGIIPGFLASDADPAQYSETLYRTREEYNLFNLVFGSREALYWFSSCHGTARPVPPGFHGLSNRDLDTPWPKVEKSRKAFEAAVKEKLPDDAFFALLKDTERPPDHLLPDTGVGKEWERLLSPIFIESPTYGTRCSTLLKIRDDGRIHIIERSYDLSGPGRKFTDREFTLPGQA